MTEGTWRVLRGLVDWVSRNWLGRQQECYQPLGDLYLRFPSHATPESYRRELDIGTLSRLTGAQGSAILSGLASALARPSFFADASIVMGPSFWRSGRLPRGRRRGGPQRGRVSCGRISLAPHQDPGALEQIRQSLKGQ